MKHAASIHSNGNMICSCMLLDISEAGARLAMVEDVLVPDRFVLCLSQNDLVRRQCQVLCRVENELRVMFRPS